MNRTGGEHHRFPEPPQASTWTIHLALLVGVLSGSVGRADWRPVECIPVDLPPEQLHQGVRSMDGFEDGAGAWAVATDEQHAAASLACDPTERHGGAASLRVDYDFVGKKDYEYVQLGADATFEESGLGVGFWLKHDGTPLILRLRFTDRSGEWHQTELLCAPVAGWQYVAGMLDGPSTSWGGDGNLRKDYPCQLAGIVMDRPHVGFVGQGSVWIDDTEIVRKAPMEMKRLPLEVQDVRMGNLYAVGETVMLRSAGDGHDLRWRVTDYFGVEVDRGQASADSAEVRFSLHEPGWFDCRMERMVGDRVVSAHRFSCAALAGGMEAARTDFFGVCTHYGQQTYPLETMDLMRRYGMDQFRDEVTWRSYETEKGQRRLPEYAATYLEHAAERGLRPLIIYDYSNPYYDDDGFPNSSEAIAAFAAYALDLTRQTQGRVAMFEVWNEWIGGCGMNGRPGAHDGAAYGRLLRPVYAAVKAEFPDVTVVGIGGEYGAGSADHMVAMLEAAGPDAMDAWSIHPYRYPHAPERSDLVGEVRDIGAKMAEAGATTPAWITEIGYPTHRGNRGSDERSQARYAIRTLALLQSMPGVEKVFWYDFKNDGLTREYNEHNFGVVHHQTFNCAPKPAVVAMSVFIRMTGSATPIGLTRRGALHRAAYRRADDTEVQVLWTDQGAQHVTISGTLLASYDIMGRSLPLQPERMISQDPAYLVGRGLTVTP